MPGIKLQSVSFRYQQTPVLQNLSFEIKAGTFLGITGTNGSGKSTLLYLLNGLIPHEIPGRLSGKIFVDGISTRQKPVSFFAKTVGLVFQNPDFSLFNLTVKEELEFGLKNLKIKDSSGRIKQALNQVGMFNYLNRDPQTLSFGQKQKICLASVLTLNTDYIVLDEPTAMLDYRSSVELYEILSKLNQSGKTIIVVEHDTDFLLKYSQQVLILDAGKIKAFGPTKPIFSQTALLKNSGVKIPRL
ncbi:MAG: ABC transporter ATP-binding protein [Candidatus Beckwithbacteria bacterium]|nr:ABC transporter ATP-binding protein [Candidatus Beckwithbacteria bacterium]